MLALSATVLSAGPAGAATASLTLSPAAATAESNTITTFTLGVTCNGPGNCNGMVVSIPTNAVTGNGTRTDFGTWVGGAACPGITRSVAGGQLTFTYATLAPGSQNCAFTMRSPEYTTLNGAVATLTPTVSGPGLPTVTGAPAKLTLSAGHNVSTGISGQNKVLTGATFSYSLTLVCGANRQYDGDIGLSAIHLEATLPANFVYSGYTPLNSLPGTYSTPAVGSSGGTFAFDDPTGAACGNPPLNVNNAIVITIQGSMTGSVGTTACATASSTFTYIDRTVAETQSATTSPCPTIVNLSTVVSKSALTQSSGNVGQYLFNGARLPYTFPGDWDQTKASLSYDIKMATTPATIAAGVSYSVKDPLPCLDNLSGIIYSSNASGVLCQNPGFIPVRITAASFTPTAADAVHLLFADGTTSDIPYASGAWTMPTAPASPISEIQFPPFASEGTNTGGTLVLSIDGYAAPAAVPGRVLRNTMTTQAYLSDAANPTGSPIGNPQTGIANAGIVDQKAGAGETGAAIFQPLLTNTLTGTCVASVGLRTSSGRANNLEITRGPSEAIYVNYLAPVGATIANSTVSPTLREVFLPTRQYPAGALTATITPDYDGTGRTMYAWTIPAGLVQIPGVYDILNFQFSVTLPAGCAGSYPSDMTIGYQAPITSCIWTNFVSPYAQVPPLAPSNNNDLDTNGSPIAGNYCGYSSPIVVASANSGFSIIKQVQGSLDAAPVSAGTTGTVGVSGGEATYSVTFTNTGSTTLTSPVFYDLLPHVGDTETTTLNARDSQFGVTLLSLGALPSGVTVEYSTAANPCRPEVLSANPGCTDDWSAAVPASLSSTTALRYTRAGTLAVIGAGTSSFAVSYDVSTPAVAAGRIAWNSVGANANSAGNPVGAAESTKVGLEADGQPAIVKTSSAPTFGAVGDEVTFTYTVTNEASVPVSDVSVADEFTAAAAGSTPGAVTCVSLTGPDAACTSSGSTDLLANQSATFTMTYTVRQADLNYGLITDRATVSATPDRGPELSNISNTVTVNAVQSPALTLLKTVSPLSVNGAGDSVSYSFLVTNAGNVTLTSVGVNETAFGGSGTTPAATCPTSTLAPDASVTCTASYTVTQDDVDAGSIDNTAIAAAEFNGAGVQSPSSSAQVTVEQEPSLTLKKSANLDSVGSAGQSITYSFLVTNDGNVTIDGIEVAETSFSGTGSLGAISCPTTVLAPADDTTCTAEYTVTQADIDSGAIDNAAQVTGDNPFGVPVPTVPTSSVSIEVLLAPALTLTKTADVTSVTKPGDVIQYSFLVINNGNTTLRELTVDETEFTGAGTMGEVTCPETTLAPTEEITCTAEYTVGAADASSSTISNTAEASATYSRASLPVTVTSEASTAVVEVEVPVGLAHTGLTSWAWSAGASAVALGLGATLLVFGWRRRSRA